MGIIGSFGEESQSMRTLLTKVVPMSWLRAVKYWLTDRSIERIKKSGGIIPYKSGMYKEGLNLMGDIYGSNGLAQSCRLIADQLTHTGYDYKIVQAGDIAEYDINIWHVQPLDIATELADKGKAMWDGHYNIGFWLWELEEFPDNWKRGLEAVDEIWTPSEFASESIRRVTDKPVCTMPYCVTAPTDEHYDRTYFKLPKDRFLFLSMYDTNSTMARKNPEGAIAAFKKAFSPDDERVGLVLKMNNPKNSDIDRLKELMGDYTNIYCIDESMDKVAVNSLVACVDVLVSLHRAEGFGLVMAEAMLNGTPCIATDWSSNTEFMNDEVACMVKCTFTTLKKTCEPYKKGTRWAEPDTDIAAGYMKRLLENVSYYEDKVVKAKSYVSEKLSMESAVDRMRARIEYIRGCNQVLVKPHMKEL